MRRSIATALLMGLCACNQGPQVAVDPGPEPMNYREIVKTAVHDTFFDPYSLRDVSVTEPHTGRMYRTEGWLVCVRANGKNRMGAYAGMSETVFLIRNGIVVDSDSEAAVCAQFPHTPWPEMEMAGEKK